MNSPNEQELLNGARAYDNHALGAIYDLYSPKIYRYAMRLLGDDCLAEDCVADTFSRFLKALRSGQGPQDHLQAYLYRVAHNWITDSFRRLPPPALDLEESMQSEEQNQPERQTDLRLEQQQVQLALRSLTPDQRQVVCLRFMEGWENEEVANALQKPVGTIRVLQHRAIDTLRRIILQEGKEDAYETAE